MEVKSLSWMILLKYSYIGYWQLDLYANTILGDSVSDTATVTQSVTNHKTWNIFMLKIKEEACTQHLAVSNHSPTKIVADIICVIDTT